MDVVIGYALVEPRIDAYKDIFTSAQGNELGNRPKDGTRIREITGNMLINWRSAAYVAGMPPQYAIGNQQTLLSYAKSPTGNTELLNLAAGMLSRLTGKVPDLFADPVQRRTVHDALIDLGAEFQEILAKTPLNIDLEIIWKDYLTVPAFQQYVWSSERLSYQSVYNAYEEFVVECVRVANNQPKLRTAGKDKKHNKDFKWWFRQAFGDPMLQDCWTHTEVNRIRLIRHSLAHAGGRLTDDIQTQKIKVREHEGVIHMFPGDVRDAIATLGKCVIKLIDAANTKPEFN